MTNNYHASESTTDNGLSLNSPLFGGGVITLVLAICAIATQNFLSRAKEQSRLEARESTNNLSDKFDQLNKNIVSLNNNIDELKKNFSSIDKRIDLQEQRLPLEQKMLKLEIEAIKDNQVKIEGELKYLSETLGDFIELFNLTVGTTNQFTIRRRSK